MNKFIRYLPYCALLLLSACAQTSTPSVPKVEFEIQGPEEQSALLIDAAPTEFKINFENDALAWERTRLFFSKYTAKPLISELDKKGESLEIASQLPSEKYFFRVKHILQGQGFKYLVTCVPNPAQRSADNLAANRNAKNLARFIKDGELDVGFLAR